MRAEKNVITASPVNWLQMLVLSSCGSCEQFISSHCNLSIHFVAGYVGFSALWSNRYAKFCSLLGVIGLLAASFQPVEDEWF